MKMDFLDAQKEYIEKEGIPYGDGEIGRFYIDLLTFQPNREYGKQGVISRFKGRIAFVDKDHVREVGPGDSFICRIDPFSGDVGIVYYAIPLIKIDEGVVMRLQPETARAIEDRLWEKHRSLYDSRFDSRAREEMTLRIQSELDESHRKDLADRDGRIEELEKRIRDLRNRLAEGRGQDSGIQLSSEEIVLSSDVPPPAPAARMPEPAEDAAASATDGMFAPSQPTSQKSDLFGIGKRMRIGDITIRGDVVSCPRFPDGNYFVHISPDKRRLLIRYNEQGGAICRNGNLLVHGLHFMPGCGTGEENHPDGEYNDRFDGVLISL